MDRTSSGASPRRVCGWLRGRKLARLFSVGCSDGVRVKQNFSFPSSSHDHSRYLKLPSTTGAYPSASNSSSALLRFFLHPPTSRRSLFRPTQNRNSFSDSDRGLFLFLSFLHTLSTFKDKTSLTLYSSLPTLEQQWAFQTGFLASLLLPPSPRRNHPR